MAERILVVEDDPRMADLLRRGLIFEGYQVELTGDGETALNAAREQLPDLVVLDLMLPGQLDGLEVCRRLRAGSDVPILVLTARGTLGDKVSGLDSGADDYLVKADFHFEELVARIRALLRRPNGALGMRLKAGNLEYDASSSAVSVGGDSLPLPRRELTLLELLMRRVGQVVTRQTIENGLYGFDDDVDSNAMEASVSRLRKRLSAAGATVNIHTVRGVGYMLTADKPAAAVQ